MTSAATIITIPAHDDAQAMLAEFPIGTEVQISQTEAISIGGVTAGRNCDTCGPLPQPIFEITTWNHYMTERFGHDSYDCGWYWCLKCAREVFNSDDPRAAVQTKRMFD